VITKHNPEQYYVVTNAGRRDEDLSWFETKIKEWNASHSNQVQHEVLENWGLVALQGPKAADYLQGFVEASGKNPYDLKQLTFGKCATLNVAGSQVHVARGGYTGEDGFEVSLDILRLIPSACANISIDIFTTFRDSRMDSQNPQIPCSTLWFSCA
jgi:aminomethyltransferase